MRVAYQAIGRLLAAYLFERFYAVAIGTGNIPAFGPTILAGNHQEAYDGILVLRGARLRRVIMMVKTDGEKPVTLYLLNLLGDTLSIHRSTGDLEAMRLAIGVLERGDVLCMFPEGHRSESGKVKGFHPGIATIARHIPSAKIVPFGITNASHLGVGKVVTNLDRGVRREKNPTIRFGPAFRLPPAHLPIKQQREEDIANIRRRVLALLPEDMEGKDILHVVEQSPTRKERRNQMPF